MKLTYQLADAGHQCLQKSVAMVRAPKSCAVLPLPLQCFLPGAREQQPAAAQPCVWSYMVTPTAKVALKRRFSLLISFQDKASNAFINPVMIAGDMLKTSVT